jgi:hypothetical protein
MSNGPLNSQSVQLRPSRCSDWFDGKERLANLTGMSGTLGTRASMEIVSGLAYDPDDDDDAGDCAHITD